MTSSKVTKPEIFNFLEDIFKRLNPDVRVTKDTYQGRRDIKGIEATFLWQFVRQNEEYRLSYADQKRCLERGSLEDNEELHSEYLYELRSKWGIHPHLLDPESLEVPEGYSFSFKRLPIQKLPTPGSGSLVDKLKLEAGKMALRKLEPSPGYIEWVIVGFKVPAFVNEDEVAQFARQEFRKERLKIDSKSKISEIRLRGREYKRLFYRLFCYHCYEYKIAPSRATTFWKDMGCDRITFTSSLIKAGASSFVDTSKKSPWCFLIPPSK